jgi:hypothetical protein
MTARIRKDSFERIYNESMPIVYEEAFSICYDEATATETTVDFFLYLEKKLRTSAKTFNSVEWIRETVAGVCRELIGEKIKNEMKTRRVPGIRDETTAESAFLEFPDDKIARLIQDIPANDEIFRNLSAGEKAVLALTCVRNMDEKEAAAYLMTSVKNIKSLKERGTIKIVSSMRFFGKIG